MKLAIELGGKQHTVELVRTSERLRCNLDGRALDADAVEVALGIYSILIGGESLEARVEPLTETGIGGLRVIVGSREFSVGVHDPRQWRRRSGASAEAKGRQQVLAPMPGKIIRVLVKTGDSIEMKQGLVVVEAMKMQNEIRSPKSGTVERLLVTEGQSVNTGEVLAIIS
ncbi:MAG TPA: biotin/lipoyl-containing protein [Candidatus Limnocylindria bacterium]|nr:biotin/lipoyl-containing protein [Candidatus Limnocylindria bacterium]